jgi:hypothetical protein
MRAGSESGAENLGFLPALLALAPMAMSLAKKKKAVTTPKPPPIIQAPPPSTPLWPWLAGGGAVLAVAGVGAWLVLRKRSRR